MKRPGIYFIRNKVTKVIYVGQADDTSSRLNVHKSRLRRNIHQNSFLQKFME